MCNIFILFYALKAVKGMVIKMEIIKDGIMISKVILPEIPTPREKFAAEELSIYLEKNAVPFRKIMMGKLK